MSIELTRRVERLEDRMGTFEEHLEGIRRNIARIDEHIAEFDRQRAQVDEWFAEREAKRATQPRRETPRKGRDVREREEPV